MPHQRRGRRNGSALGRLNNSNRNGRNPRAAYQPSERGDFAAVEVNVALVDFVTEKIQLDYEFVLFDVDVSRPRPDAKRLAAAALEQGPQSCCRSGRKLTRQNFEGRMAIVYGSVRVVEEP